MREIKFRGFRTVQSEVEVVGNIYDNPELLGGADDAERTNVGR